MLRCQFNFCFSLALGTITLLKLTGVREDWIWFALFCVGVTAILTNFMLVRFMGLGGVGGLSILYHNLADISAPVAFLILLTAGLLSSGVFLAVWADLTHSASKERNDKQII
jgi:hypothetical protein